MNEKRYQSLAVIWILVLVLVQGINLLRIPGMYINEKYFIYVSIHLLILVLIAIYSILIMKKIKNGPIVGITIGIVYLVIYNTDNIVNTILGILLIITNIGMLIELGQNKNDKKQVENKEAK